MANPNKLALITGASRGLGAAVAQNLGASGFHVIAVARTIGALEELDDRIQAQGGHVTLVPADLSDRDAVSQICAALHERWGGLDLWVHTAIHAAPLAPVGHISAKDFDKTILHNVTATQHLIACVDPLLRANGGQAVYCADPVDGQKFFGAYGASKAAQCALFQSWAAENTQSGPKVLEFTPQPMPTATRARFYPGEDREHLNTTDHQAKRLVELLNI